MISPVLVGGFVEMDRALMFIKIKSEHEDVASVGII